jgi:dUTP pyrophosphatase
MAKERLGRDVECMICKKTFYASQKRLTSKTITCSRECGGKITSSRLSKKVLVYCIICNKEMYRKASQKYRVLYPACSHKCKSKVSKKYRTGEKNSNFKKLTPEERFFNNRASSCNRRGKLLGKEHDLSGFDLMSIYHKQKGLCLYTGYKMSSDSQKNSHSISVDRIDSEKGYTKSNVVLCCLSINMMKSNYRIYDMIQILESYMSKEENRIPLKIVNNTEFEIKKNSVGNVGMDLYVNEIEDCGNYIKVKTGVHVQPPIGFYLDLVVRSSTHKKGLALYNGVGIIDQSYTGEIIAILYKTSDFKDLPLRGDRLVQLIPRRCLLMDPIIVDNLDETERGAGGFGSTGER